MKRKALIVAGVLGLSLVTGCSSKDTNVKEVETSVSSSEADTTAETKESEVSEPDTDFGGFDDDINYSIFKESTTEDRSGKEVVVMYGLITDVSGETYTIYTRNGEFVFTLNENTVLPEDVTLGEGIYVEVVNSGIVTMSLPGQIADVLEVRVVDASDVVEEGKSIDDLYSTPNEEDVFNDVAIMIDDYTVYPDVKYSDDLSEVTFFGEVAEIVKSDEYDSYYVYTANGTKIFNVNADVNVDESIEKGSYVTIVTDGIETRSLPGELSGISSFEVADTDIVSMIEGNKNKVEDVDNAEVLEENEELSKENAEILEESEEEKVNEEVSDNGTEAE